MRHAAHAAALCVAMAAAPALAQQGPDPTTPAVREASEAMAAPVLAAIAGTPEAILVAGQCGKDTAGYSLLWRNRGETELHDAGKDASDVQGDFTDPLMALCDAFAVRYATDAERFNFRWTWRDGSVALETDPVGEDNGMSGDADAAAQAFFGTAPN